MSKETGILAKLNAIARAQQDEPDDASPVKRGNEELVYAKIQREAKARGATLQSDGRGGLPAQMALECFRKNGWKCAVCGSRENLTIHHLGGIVSSALLDKMGHKPQQRNLVTVCEKDHDLAHSAARAVGEDSSQVKPQGDRSG